MHQHNFLFNVHFNLLSDAYYQDGSCQYKMRYILAFQSINNNNNMNTCSAPVSTTSGAHGARKKHKINEKQL